MARLIASTQTSALVSTGGLAIQSLGEPGRPLEHGCNCC
jgi:hypothetical protein